MRTNTWIRATALLALPGLAVSCGGSNGSSPQNPTRAATPVPTALVSGATVRIVSGEDDTPVEGARVILAGREYTSDAAGQVTLGATVPYGSFVDVIADGFLNRQTVVPQDGTSRFSLWPRETASGMSEEFTAQLVYTYGWAEEPEHGTSRLLRIREGFKQVFVMISDEIQRDGRAHEMHQSAVDEMTAALGGRAAYVLTSTRPAGGILVDIRLATDGDQACSDGALGYFRAWATNRGEIARGEIAYCALWVARTSTVTHELGHSVGLQHSYGTDELMNPRFSRFLPDHFSPREALAMRLLFERPAGNRFPDSDRDVMASTAGVRQIVCY